MAQGRRTYAGGYIDAQLNGPLLIAAGVGATFTYVGVLPVPNTGPLLLEVGPGLASDEKLLISSAASGVAIIAARGVDGTAVVDHQPGEVVRHVHGAGDANEANAHVNDLLLDDHSQYLNLARHDLPARHTFGAGAPLGLPLAATISRPGDIASDGTGVGPARSDHVHGREAYGVGLSAATPPGSVAADGTSPAEARADHVHGRLSAETFTALSTVTLAATGAVSAQSLVATGLTGATAASRHVGATASGAPTSGTFAVGDFVVDQAGFLWVCTTAGSPGTWASAAAQATKITARAYRNAGWGLATNAPLVFDQANWDPFLCFNGSGGPGKFTCPLAGYYQISGALSCLTTAAGQVMVSMLLKNGPAQTSGTFSGACSGAGQILTSSVSDLVFGAVGDVFTMAMQFNPFAIAGTAGTNFTYMAVQYVHP